MPKSLVGAVVGWSGSSAIHIYRRFSTEAAAKDELRMAVVGRDHVLGIEALVAGVATRPDNNDEGQTAEIAFGYRVPLKELIEPGTSETLVSVAKLTTALRDEGWNLATLSTGDVFVSVHVAARQGDESLEGRLRFDYVSEGVNQRPPESLTLTPLPSASDSKAWPLARNKFSELRQPATSLSRRA